MLSLMLKGDMLPVKSFQESRVVAATLTILNIGTLDKDPDESALPSSLGVASKDSKKGFLNKLASDVVSRFVLKTEALVKKTQAKIEAEQELAQLMKTADGKFKCQEPSCLSTFQFNGKHKKVHEKAAHGMRKVIASKTFDDSDDMYNYQCSLLEYLVIVRNFTVHRTPTHCILRCWRFLLPYMKADSSSSRKYCLEELYLLCQVNCLLSPRESYRLVWNRGVKRKTGLGGNIPIDLAMEHYIRIMKLLKRKLGSNQHNSNTLQRYMKAIGCTKVLFEDFDEMTG
eukprot:gene10331-11404_t